jgi:DNA-binding LacI/PurR family transcriptional regulator
LQPLAKFAPVLDGFSAATRRFGPLREKGMHLQPMTVTLKDVADRAGVSRSAVSRSFTEGASVSARTRAKVRQAVDELGYRPSLIARSLATKRSGLIGLVANNFQNPVFLDVFDLFTSELQTRGFRPLLVNLTNETDPEKSLNLLRQYGVDGVIVATSTLAPSFASAFRKARIPVIHTFGKFESAEDVHVIGIDNIRCGELAAETLAGRAYRRCAAIGGPGSATSTKDRIAGFTRRAKELGLAVTDILYAENYTYSAGRAAMEVLLPGPVVEAVFCGDDLICMGAMDAARDRGLLVPSDIGFLGVNDIAMAAWSAFNLTTIRQPIREIILSSVDLVIALIDDPTRSAQARLFDCSVVERGTLRGLQQT